MVGCGVANLYWDATVGAVATRLRFTTPQLKAEVHDSQELNVENSERRQDDKG